MSGDGQSETCCPELWDRINELETVLYTLKAQREWVSVEERLPSPDDRVLVTNALGHMSLSSCTIGIDTHTWSVGTVNYPTHWQSLPPAPEVNSDE